jgi:glutamate-ammonia-ligase adenylyltransferase
MGTDVSRIETAATATADPETALPRLAEAVDRCPSLADARHALEPLAHLFAGSDALSTWLSRRPGDIGWLVDGHRLTEPRGEKDMRRHVDELIGTEETPEAALRVFRSRELARIAARELSGAADLSASLAEWSTVADVAVDAACRVADAEAKEIHGTPYFTPLEGGERREAAFAVLGMGKLGGRELNISSDIDLIYVHSSDNGETTGGGGPAIGLHEYFIRLARRVTRLLNDVTDLGQVFRVDVDLRPEGRSGELTNSVGAMEIYYESWGQMWERQAFIKARHVGGAAAVSEEVLARLKPFTYRKYLDRAAIDDVAVMKDKIDAQLKSGKSVRKAADNIKLGYGGIREIEFVVQALQLLSGAHYPELTTRSTLKGLDVCVSLGLLSRPHYVDLREAYLFYRRLENRIQYHQLNQTHHIPEYPHRRGILARQMGIADADPATALMAEVDRRRHRVRKIFDLFFSKDDSSPDRFPFHLDEEEIEPLAEWLDHLRFNQPTASARQLIELRNGRPFSHPSPKSRTLFDSFGPILVAEAAATAWPDNVLIGFAQFVDAKGARDSLYDLLDKNRSVIRLLASLFAASESLTTVLIKAPDVLDSLLVADQLHRPGDDAVNRRRFAAILADGETVGATLARMNLYKAYESLRLGIGRILGKLDRFDVMKGLTLLAETYLSALMELAKRKMAEEGVPPLLPPFALFACGKLARREMNFGSDLDLILFYEGDVEAGLPLLRLAQTAMRMSKELTPNGAGYDIDMRLRPEGENAPLAISRIGAESYYAKRGESWERLALVGARPVVGDETFSRTMSRTLDRFVGGPLTPEEYARIGGLRERIADEKVRPHAIDVKFGRGGLIEIEFIAQFLAMERTDAPGPDGGEPVTHALLTAAERHGWLDRRSARTLQRAYLVYRSVEDALRMDRVKPVNTVPAEGPDMERTARRAALPGVGPDRFVETVKETMREVRAIYEAFMAERTGKE